MIKIIATTFTFVMLVFSVNAQVYPKTVGLRFGVSNYGIGPEFSYQHGLGDYNRIEANVGMGFDGNYSRIGITGVYHFVFDLESGFAWYIGPGVQGWFYSYNTNYYGGNNSNGLGAAVGGQVGFQYDFNEELELPFMASVDTRPMFNFGSTSRSRGFGFGAALTLRYTF